MGIINAAKGEITLMFPDITVKILQGINTLAVLYWGNGMIIKYTISAKRSLVLMPVKKPIEKRLLSFGA